MRPCRAGDVFAGVEAAPHDTSPPHPEALWQQFALPLRSFIAKRASREVDVEDLLQDVFLRVQAHLPSLRQADRVDAWIFQIARGVVADAFRKRARYEALNDRHAADEPPSVTAEDERAAEVALSNCLASLIELVREPYRQAIELTELRGMTQPAAARVAGISISGMKSRVQRGRRQLETTIREFCRVETDARGGVIACDPVRPSGCPSDSMNMTDTEPTNTTEMSKDDQAATTGCCGGAAPKGVNACCARDAEVKAAGGSGCGCRSKTASPTRKACC